MNIYVIVLKNTTTNTIVSKPIGQFLTSRQAFGTLAHQVQEDQGFHHSMCDYYGTPQAQPLRYVVTKRQFDADDVQVRL